MAISLVAATTPVVTTTTPSSVNVTLPSGIQDDDLLILWVGGQNAYANAEPFGWTFWDWVACSNPTDYAELDVMVRVGAAALSGTTVTVPVTYDPGTLGPRTTMIVTVYRSSLGRGLRVINQAGNYANGTSATSIYQWPYTNPGPGAMRGAVAVLQLPASSSSYSPPATTGFTAWSSTAYTDMQLWGYSTSTDFAVGVEAPEKYFSATVASGVAMAALQLHMIEKQFAWTQTEGLGLSRTVARNDAIALVLADALRLRDTSSPLWRKIISVAEGLGLSDSIARALGALLTQMVPLTDTLTPKVTYRQIVTDALRVVESLQRGAPVSLTDQLQLARAVVAVRALTVIEGLGLAETLAGALKLKVTQTEQLGFAETLMRFLGGGVVEGLGLHQTEAALRATLGVVTEGLGVAEALAPKLLLRIDAADTLVLDDAEVLKLLFKPVISEELEISAAYLAPNGNFTTWAVNTRTGAVSEYTNFAFNSFAQSGHKVLAASNDGLYELVGDTDNGTDIVAAIKSGYMQMNDSRFTGLKAVYLGVRGGGEYFLKLETPQGSTTYRVIAEDMATTKVWVGKGLRTRYLAFELVSTGQDFDLESIEFVPMRATRRV